MSLKAFLDSRPKLMALLVAIAFLMLLGWQQYRTHFGWIIAETGYENVHTPHLIIREFLDPILPDEDGIYRFEYWQDHVMRESTSYSSDSFRARKAHLEWRPNGTCEAWLEDRKIYEWKGEWSRSH